MGGSTLYLFLPAQVNNMSSAEGRFEEHDVNEIVTLLKEKAQVKGTKQLQHCNPDWLPAGIRCTCVNLLLSSLPFMLR